MAAILSVEAERHDAIDFTHAFSYDEFFLAVCSREEFFIQSDITIAPFQWLVWIAIAVVLATTSGLYFVFTSFSTQWRTCALMNGKSIRPTVPAVIWFIIGSFLKQG